MNKNIILTILELEKEKYQAMVIDTYLIWCNLNTFSDRDCQKLLANAALFAWWLKQYHELEEKFIEEAAEYFGKADAKTMRTYYREHTINIKLYYSKTLITAARRQQPLTPQHN